MTMRLAVFCSLLLAAGTATAAEQIVLPKKLSERPQLKTIYSSVHQLTDFVQKDTKAVACIFMGTVCPVAQQYAPRLAELHEEYKKQGVQFLAIYSNSEDHVMSMATHAHDADLPYPALLDFKHRLADLLEARRTPEVVLIDAKLRKHYQGAIDDQFTKRGRRAAANRHYLKDAIDQVLAGKEVTTAITDGNGCPIERQEPLAAEGPITYFRDVAPLIQNNCLVCHRDGEVGPFELASYEDVYYAATRIAEVVVERRMPPWHGQLNPKFGKLHNDKRLTDREIRTIVGWVKGGAKKGDPNDAPDPIHFPPRDQWKIGKPDFVYKMPKPFAVPKTGTLDYQFFRVKMNLKEDRWFNAVEVRPGNAEVVHHVAMHVVKSGNREYSGFTGMSELYGFSTDSAHLINDYVPGDTYNAKIYPAHQAVRIPKGSDLIYELHYTPNNREATTDQSMVAFRWADKPPKEEILTKVFRKPIGRFRIPPHHPHYRMEDAYYFRQDVYLDAIRPHFHYRGKSFRVEVIERDEDTDKIIKRETVIAVPVFDPDWQRTYELETPLLVKAGTEILATGIFDNSSLNPSNPDPSQTVLWGQQTADEMFSTRFKYRLAEPAQK
jgi:peroxiredoxin